MSVQITEQDFYDMRAQRDNERTKNLTLQIELARLIAANDNTNALLDEQSTHINEQALKIAHLTKINESMQEDAVQNTYAFNLMLTANKAQADEIHAIKEAIEDVKYYYVGNPSAWEYYDDGVSEKIRAILKAAGMA